MATAEVIYNDGVRCLVLCPYCLEVEAVGGGAPAEAACGGGNYKIGRQYDFKVAKVALRRREADCARKRVARAARPPPAKECGPIVE